MVGVALAAFVFTFSLVPLYRIACEKVFGITPGARRRPKPAQPRRSKDDTRWVTVQFDGGVNSKLPWEFEPEQADACTCIPASSTRRSTSRATPATAPSSATPCPRSRRRAPRVISARPNASASPRRRSPPANRATCRCASSSTRRCRPTHTITLSYTFYKNDALTAQLNAAAAHRAAAARGALTRTHSTQTENRHGPSHDAHATTHDANVYYVPHGSRWPVLASVALFITMFGFASWLNESSWGRPVFFVGLVLLAAILFMWFGDVIGESLRGIYNKQVDTSFRMGMMWFIFSEVMFFAAFFGALFYARQYAMPWLNGEGDGVVTNSVLWPASPPAGRATARPRSAAHFETIPAWGLPLVNTLILLSSGVTVTIAHHALQAGHRSICWLSWAAPCCSARRSCSSRPTNTSTRTRELNLTLGSGIYGSTFFMLTGFHGAHVTLGTIMLSMIWLRCLKGHFTATTLRVRSGGLVLALRRRGVAGAVPVRLRAVTPAAACKTKRPDRAGLFRFNMRQGARPIPCGLIQPMQIASATSRISATDSAMRQVSALTVRLVSPLSTIM